MRILFVDAGNYCRSPAAEVVCRTMSVQAGAVLLLGHIDVVEARREDWTRDPFVLVEEDGYFYGRGTADMKGLDAIWVDTLIRLKQAKAPPKRTLGSKIQNGTLPWRGTNA